MRRHALDVDGRAAEGGEVAQQVGVLPVQVAEDLDGRAHGHHARVAPEAALLGQLAHAQQLGVAEQVRERTRAACAGFAAAAPTRRTAATAVPAAAAAAATTTIAAAAAASAAAAAAADAAAAAALTADRETLLEGAAVSP